MAIDLIILSSALALIIFSVVLTFVTRYKKCPSDKLLVIYGKTSSNKSSKVTNSAKVYHGGGAFVWPVIQNYAYLDLKPISINVDLRGALSKQNIRLDVPSTFTIGISTEPYVMQNAAERLLGLNKKDIENLARDIIFGQLRLVIATMDIEEINANRDKLLSAVQENVEAELIKIGLKLINVNITDIQDESGYIQALGKEAAAKALNDARVSVSEKDRDGSIGSTEANKEQRVKVAELNSSADVGEADATASADIGIKNADVTRRKKTAELDADAVVTEAEAKTVAVIGIKDAETNRRIKLAELDADAIDKENIYTGSIAMSNAQRQIIEAESKQKSETAKIISEAKTLEEGFIAQKAAEKERAEKNKMSLYADEVVKFEIEKEKVIIESIGIAQRTREIAKGEADAIYLKKEAEAKGLKAILENQAQGFNKIIEAANGDPDKAVQLMIADKLEELMKIQVEAIKNIKIDKITVWDSGSNSQNGSTTTSNFLQGLLKSLPAYDELYKNNGLDLPNLLKLNPSPIKDDIDSTTEILPLDELPSDELPLDEE